MISDLSELVAEMTDEHTRRSLGVIGATASHPFYGVRLARAAGVNVDTFGDAADLRTLWATLQVAADHRRDRFGAARLACRALEAAGCWWADGPVDAMGPLWSREAVGMLFDSYPGTAAVPVLSARLLELTSRIRRVSRLARAFTASVENAHALLNPRRCRNSGRIKTEKSGLKRTPQIVRAA